MRTILFLIFFVSSLAAQGMQKKEVPGFSGGMANSLTNKLMRDNMALVLENYDIEDNGAIKPRLGYRRLYSDSYMGKQWGRIVPYYSDYKQVLLSLRSRLNVTPDTAFTTDSMIGLRLNVITVCNEATGACSTLVDTTGSDYATHRYFPRQDVAQATFAQNTSTILMNNTLYLFDSRGDLLIYNGTELRPARPMAPGEPFVTALDSVSGEIDGWYTYAVAGWDSASSTTSPSTVESWVMRINNGRSFMYDIPEDAFGLYERILILRRKIQEEPGGGDAYFKIIDSILPTQTWFIDSISDDTADVRDSLEYDTWGGYKWRCEDDGTNCTNYDGGGGYYLDNTYPALGAIRGREDTLWSPAVADSACAWGVNNMPCGLVGTFGCNRVSYRVYVIDSFGVRSKLGAPSCINVGNNAVGVRDDTVAVDIEFDNIGADYDSAQHIDSAVLIRNEAVFFTASPGAGAPTYFYDTLSRHFPSAKFNVTPANDSCRGSDSSDLYVFGANLWFTITKFGGLGGIIADYKDTINSECAFLVDTAQYSPLDDSVLTFRPRHVVLHGYRAFAIGDISNKDNIYYSEFGRPTTWALDKKFGLLSEKGDWPIRLASLDDELVVFTERAVYRVTGLDFFSFSVTQVSANRGLAAERSLAVGSNRIFYMGTEGVYEYLRLQGVREQSLSVAIQNSLDSISALPSVYGTMINDEYWLSDDSTTYVFSMTPAPHWKAYSFAVKDAVAWDTAKATDTYYATDKYALLINADTVMGYGYSDTDTLDDTSQITSTYQSKYFFDDATREKIFWVELYGTGSPDSLSIVALANGGIDTLVTKTVVADFSNDNVVKFSINAVAESFSLKWSDFGASNYTVEKYIIGYMPWDEGKIR